MMRIFVAVGVLWGLCAGIAAAAEGTAAGGWELSVVFDQTIQEKGLAVRRENLSPEELTVGGKKVWAWAARPGSAKGVPWGRSVFFTVTDERFKQGKQPGVDIEIVYLKKSNMPIHLRVDADKGSQEVTSAYWGSPDWQTLQARVDGAFFGARQHGHVDGEMHTDGFDLRINSFSEDFLIRSITIRGYDLDDKVDYQRLLKLESVSAKDDLLLFTPGQKETLTYQFWNMSHKPVDGELAYTITDRAGQVLRQGSTPAVVAGGGRTQIPVPLDTIGFKYGVHSVNLTLTDKTSRQTLLQRESYVGVCNDTRPLPKAKEGEFLYGLDMCLDHYDNPGPRLAKWTDVMGVDIIRGGGFEPENRKQIAAAVAFWQPHGMRIMPMCAPPNDMNQEVLERRAQALEDVARKYPQFKYWELGNEPDLLGFWPGPISDYVRGYTELYKGIKAGNPHTFVGNGGLSLAGEAGKARSREFVQLVDPQYVDIWTYHAHGRGVNAERVGFEYMRRLVREAGKDTKPFMETESGMAAKHKSQEDMQAQTCIEKMVFAQSVDLPLHMWFRLLMFEEDYGCLRTEQEPRPVILAYRAMVEALRGHQFKSLLDLQTSQTEAYLFEQNGGNSRALVLWANEAARHGVYLSLASSGQKVTGVRALDLYGNPTPLQVGEDGVVKATITDSPIFVKWETAEPAHLVSRVPGPLQVPAAAQLVFGKENRLSVQVRNPSAQPLAAVVKVQATGKVPLEVSPVEQSVNLQPRETRPVEFSVKVGQAQQQFRWPEAWSAFVPVDAGVDLSKLGAIPQTLPAFGGAGQAIGQRVYLKDHTIDFTQLGVKCQEKLPAVVMALVESDIDQTVTIGTSADYWMAWFVNGQPVYDTLAAGNSGGYSILDHPFDVKLKKGTNLLACKVLSGTQGFKVLVGSPAALAKARRPNEIDALQVTLQAQGQDLAREQVALDYVLPIPLLKGLAWTDALERWDAIEPTAILADKQVNNFFFKEPDSSKWWGGEKDLSAVSWMACDPQKLYLLVRVKDNTHVAAPEAAKLGQCDSLQLAVSRDGKETSDYTVGLVGDKVTILEQASASVLAGKELQAQVQRIEARGETVYRLAVDRKLIGGGTFFINFLVNDNDSSYHKQALAWRPGLVEARAPGLWYRAAVPE